LTASEKKQVNRQQNQASKQIYADKHNANTAHYANNKVGQRRENQQDRIAQGVKSGQLTAGETPSWRINKGHQQTGCRGPQGQWADADGFREETDQ